MPAPRSVTRSDIVSACSASRIASRASSPPEDRRVLRDLASWVELEIRIIGLQQTLLRHEGLREAIEEDLKQARDMSRLITKREIAMIKLKEEIAELKAEIEECRKGRT